MELPPSTAKPLRASLLPVGIVIALSHIKTANSPPGERRGQIVALLVVLLTLVGTGVLSAQKWASSPENPHLSLFTTAGIAFIVIILACYSAIYNSSGYMRFHVLLSVVVLGVPGSLSAEGPRSALKGSPMINGQEVPEFAVIAPIQVGEKLPPGMPTTIRYQIKPNRFTPVSEDADGIYYQSTGSFQKNNISFNSGGLYVTKRPPIQFYPYTGDARYHRMPLSLEAPLNATDLRKVKARVGRTSQKSEASRWAHSNL